MKQLKQMVEGNTKRHGVIDDCVALIEAEVKSKKGLTGVAIKTVFGLVKAIKPSILVDLVDGLLDDFIAALQGSYEAYQQEGSRGTLEAFFGNRSDAVAESLLSITDRRAERSTNKTLVGAYGKLRPKGKEHVVAAVPRIGALLDKHAAALS